MEHTNRLDLLQLQLRRTIGAELDVRPGGAIGVGECDCLPARTIHRRDDRVRSSSWVRVWAGAGGWMSADMADRWFELFVHVYIFGLDEGLGVCPHSFLSDLHFHLAADTRTPHARTNTHTLLMSV